MLGLEVMQVDYRDTGVGLIIDKEVTTIVLTLGLGEGRVVGVTEGDIFAMNPSLSENGL